MEINDKNNKLQQTVLNYFERLMSSSGLQKYWQQLQTFSPAHQVLILSAIILAGVVVIAGVLYLLFGKTIAIGFIASLLAGLATGAGASIALFFKEVPTKVYNTMLGAAAGIMLAATAFSLIVPGMEFGNMLWPGRGLLAVTVGMIIGGVFLDLADRRLPHIHLDNTLSEPSQLTLRKVWLFIIAITIHNFPEGLSVGVSFGVDDINNGIALAIAIGFQNIPEGLAVSLPLVALGYDAKKSVLIGTLTGLVEPIGGLLGLVAVSLFHPILPVAMGFAAGAMLFVIAEEIIPETQSSGKARHATYAVLGGFIVMLLLDNMLT